MTKGAGEVSDDLKNMIANAPIQRPITRGRMSGLMSNSPRIPLNPSKNGTRYNNNMPKQIEPNEFGSPNKLHSYNNKNINAFANISPNVNVRFSDMNYGGDS